MILLVYKWLKRLKQSVVPCANAELIMHRNVLAKKKKMCVYGLPTDPVL